MKVVYDHEVDVLSVLLSDAPVAKVSSMQYYKREVIQNLF